MKKLIIAIILATSSAAFAETRQAVVTSVETNYKTVLQHVPVRECTDVKIPVYGQKPASTGDALAGAIIGGVIGNQFGSGSGKDAMTILGAIAGADAANKNQGNQIVGYQIQQQCTEVISRQQEQVVHNYIITYEWNGRTYTYNKYRVGDRIPVTITINAN
jgi:uncharacterized protein YcfJ